MENGMKYFSTKFTVRMADARYIPSVCYKLDETIAPTVEKLTEAGEARMYPEKVRFVSGIPIPVKDLERQAAQKVMQTSPEGALAGTDKKRGNKKGGRDFD